MGRGPKCLGTLGGCVPGSLFGLLAKRWAFAKSSVGLFAPISVCYTGDDRSRFGVNKYHWVPDVLEGFRNQEQKDEVKCLVSLHPACCSFRVFR